MSITYAVPDLHGRIDLLEGALQQIFEHAEGRAGTIVTLGDYVDKGPASRAVIERLIAGVPAGWHLISLKGNHEALMLGALDNTANLSDWLAKGGDTALASYGAASPDSVPPSHREWLRALPVMHVDRHRIYVHAGIDAKRGLRKQTEKVLLWKRYKPKEQANGVRGRHVVHGHDPNPNHPLKLPGRTNLDTLAWRTGRLVVGVYDDEIAGAAIAYLEVLEHSEPHISISPQTSQREAEPKVGARRGFGERIFRWFVGWGDFGSNNGFTRPAERANPDQCDRAHDLGRHGRARGVSVS